MNRKPAHTGRITAQTGCPHEAALQELLAALRSSIDAQDGEWFNVIDFWHDFQEGWGPPEDFEPGDPHDRLFRALVAAERAVAEVQTDS